MLLSALKQGKHDLDRVQDGVDHAPEGIAAENQGDEAENQGDEREYDEEHVTVSKEQLQLPSSDQSCIPAGAPGIGRRIWKEGALKHFKEGVASGQIAYATTKRSTGLLREPVDPEKLSGSLQEELTAQRTVAMIVVQLGTYTVMLALSNLAASALVMTVPFTLTYT
jgi:hypothetical protein